MRALRRYLNKRPSDTRQRPQTLAIHLKRDSPTSKVEGYVGWTGMASSSSLAHFNADAGENAFETVEIDPQYAQGLGFAEGDVVRLFFLEEDVPYLAVAGRDWSIV